MEWLYSHGYRTLSFGEVDGFFKRAEGKAVIITFDDGYASFGSYVFPLLSEYGFKATINAIGKYMGGYLELGANRPLLSWDEYRYFMKSGLVALGCHSYNLHIYRSGLGILGFRPKEIEDDFRLFKDVAKRETGQEIQILAWPYGIFDAKAMNIAQKVGFKYILTSQEGYLHRGGNLLRIPRWNINHSHHLDSFRQYARGGK
jgi:biofilm PGA synthesis lipoprotein PgaB